MRVCNEGAITLSPRRSLTKEGKLREESLRKLLEPYK
jgi:hypothetical protein